MSGQIGVARGTALYVGAVLGPGVLVLPALAADAAGPASVLAWVVLIAVSVPVAAAFAALGMRYPDGGGVATFTRQAFGPTAGTIVGWWFYAAVPIGMVAGATAGGRYAATALGLGPTWAGGIAAALLVAAYTLNLLGLHLSGRIHLALTAGLVVLLATVIAVSLPRTSMDNFTPFAPHGLPGVGSAAVVLFVAVCGWEAATNLAPAFARPRRQMPIVAAASLSIIALLYIGLAITTIGVLGSGAAETGVPLIRLADGERCRRDRRHGHERPAAHLRGDVHVHRRRCPRRCGTGPRWSSPQMAGGHHTSGSAATQPDRAGRRRSDRRGSDRHRAA
ncbi:APC family permease [Micromonospora sp. LOL_024]|uniref:APC family permease n=1 Tax=Micromonospora sp. LOL_024 TaxID=3345412 RepID=UPI003A846A48